MNTDADEEAEGKVEGDNSPSGSITASVDTEEREDVKSEVQKKEVVHEPVRTIQLY